MHFDTTMSLHLYAFHCNSQNAFHKSHYSSNNSSHNSRSASYNSHDSSYNKHKTHPLVIFVDGKIVQGKENMLTWLCYNPDYGWLNLALDHVT